MSRNFPGNKEQKGNRDVEMMLWEKGMNIDKKKPKKQKKTSKEKTKTLSIFLIFVSIRP